ncbi:response regulator transcription factor [Bacilliculturomica massiliensis]|uniref:response regulator transcription factor n=1 Tax=Bacilliculturomica massiliensis TaxID=1917867 RepID=UPI001031EFDC|nr:response regulator transcription factor [Bacilliculturomica massiliensis]
MKTRILVAEDDDDIRQGLQYALEQEGFKVLSCSVAAAAAEHIVRMEADLCLLDVTLPDGTGYDLCKLARAQERQIPVIFLTACDAEVSVVMGLDMGADDYITKPFRIRELISRIRSVLRRCSGQNGVSRDDGSAEKNGAGKNAARQAEDVIHFGNLEIRMAEARVFRRDGTWREVQLTALEYRLLLTFARHKGQVLSRSQLLEGIWDVAGDFVNDNTVSVYIKRLREKLEEDPARPRLIETVRGFGYRAGD